MTATLERIEPSQIKKQTAPETGYELGSDLLRQASEKLGYTLPALVKKMNKACADGIIDADDELASALQKAGIKPFAAESVQQYQREFLRASKRGMGRGPIERVILGALRKHRLRRKDQSAEPTLWLICILCWMFALASGTIGFIGGLPQLGVILLSAGMIAGCIAVIILKEYGWRRFALKGYPREIPAFALLTALELNRHLPEVEFFVEEFGRKQDPFLKAVLTKTRDGRKVSSEAYLEVWDEPNFAEKKKW